MSTIVVTEDVTGPAYEALTTRWSVEWDPEAWQSPDRVRSLVSQAEVLIIRNRTQVDEALLAHAPRLKLVARAGVGLDNIDLAAADRAGVVVIAPLGANAGSVGEHALAMALALSKRLIPSDSSTKEGGWDRVPTQELAGKTWGLLSAGATARATARLARGIGMNVIAYDPFVDASSQEIVDLGLELAPLERVLAAADVLSVHLPGNEATHKMLNAKALALLPSGALVINVGRGETIDEAALLDALDSGHIAGAGLDVRATEPPRPGRLEKHPNVILTPHTAGVSCQSQERIGRILCEQIELVFGGQPATYAVGAHEFPRAESRR